MLGENMGNKDHSKGSSWHKWDLHVHTPYTYLNKAYQCCEEEFIQKLCDSQIDCIGLTNYFKFNEKEFELKEKIEKKGIKVFYNLEVRLDYQNKIRKISVWISILFFQIRLHNKK
ncbi:hypothetical protein HMPREF1408_01730 [Helicobacter pylori GAM245Ai]|nr:hypothetical protein HMPREF1408_01730 [Helicobacter pylori GAM245Ai]